MQIMNFGLLFQDLFISVFHSKLNEHYILIYIIPIPPTSICHCIIAHYNLSLRVIYFLLFHLLHTSSILTLLHSHILYIYVHFFFFIHAHLIIFILILDKLLFVTSRRENRAFGALVISLYPLLTVISYIDI